MDFRKELKNKKRIVIKVGSSSLQHKETGELDLIKLEILVRELCDLKNQGKDVVLVSSGAIAEGKKACGIKNISPEVYVNPTSVKQACAAIGQARLMMTYQKLFSEYNHTAAQILMTKNTVFDDINRANATNTFKELLLLDAIPIVNENDTVDTYEIESIGDNDTLAAIVATLIDADLLILLSDIDGLYTDDPHINKEASFVETVEKLDDVLSMGKKSTGTNIGTGGMSTKLSAAKIATSHGCDMIIANGKDMRVIHKIIDGGKHGTLFIGKEDNKFDLLDHLERNHQ